MEIKHFVQKKTLIPLKVVLFRLYTLLPAVLPLLETFLEILFLYGVQLSRRFLHDVFSRLKSGLFKWQTSIKYI